MSDHVSAIESLADWSWGGVRYLVTAERRPDAGWTVRVMAHEPGGGRTLEVGGPEAATLRALDWRAPTDYQRSSLVAGLLRTASRAPIRVAC